MIFPRRSGILLHVTSLPGGHGIGDFGESAYEFIEFLAGSGQKIWQVLPLNPTGYGDSPYQCFSAFAGNPLFINLGALREEGLLSARALAGSPSFPDEQVSYDRVIAFKQELLRIAARAFFTDKTEADRSAFDTFCEKSKEWLEDYALFMACKKVSNDTAWVHWDAGLRHRDPTVLKEWQNELSPELEFHRFAQFQFFRQWEKVRDRCRRHGISIMGDIPIYVAHDSADVWAHPELFRLDQRGQPTAVAGVPPDYFSATGQLWGNPLYRWDVSASSGHSWWIDRCRASLAMFDLVGAGRTDRREWDQGNEHFQPTTFQVSNLNAGTGAPNVIPGELKARFNLRYSPVQTLERLKQTVEGILRRHQVNFTLEWYVSGEPFYTPRGRCRRPSARRWPRAGKPPEFSTGGGTSDGRFIAALGAQIVELGVINASIHKVNEQVRTADIDGLHRMYVGVLERLLG